MDDYEENGLFVTLIGLMAIIGIILSIAIIFIPKSCAHQRSEKSKENVQDQWICETNENWNSTGTYQWKLTE